MKKFQILLLSVLQLNNLISQICFPNQFPILGGGTAGLGTTYYTVIAVDNSQNIAVSAVSWDP